jgi:tetratricopeptide (TPR) repeat protein
LGLRTWSAKGAIEAIPFLQRAVDLDPKFAMAHGRLGTALSGGAVQLSVDHMRKAYELRGRVSERERFYLECHYYDLVTGEGEKAAECYRLWQQVYPRDPAPYDNLQNVYAYLGNHEEALAEAQEHLRLQPNNVIAYEDAGRSYIYLNRQHEAQALFEQAAQRKLQSALLGWLRYQSAFLKGDAAEMERIVAATNNPALLSEQAMRESQLGRVRKARQLFRQSVNVAQEQSTPRAGGFL